MVACHMPAALPIDPLIPEILRRLGAGQNLVLEAPPGAGKTTRVPPALLALGAGEVLALEPRRLAARLAARRVAFELGERVGETAGYQVRFEQVAGPRTRLRFLTEGVLTRQLLADSNLRGVDVVVLDEFHERHLEGDLALALLRRLQRTTRPDLRLVVMSATMETAPVARFPWKLPCPREPGTPLRPRHLLHSFLARSSRGASGGGPGASAPRRSRRRRAGVFARGLGDPAGRSAPAAASPTGPICCCCRCTAT